MSHAPRLLLNHLSYFIPNTTVVFDKLCLSFTKRRYGIVGDNGAGKTTLLQLIVGVIAPHSGTSVCDVSMAYCPQIIEITARGIQRVSGNYDFYEEQKALQQTSIQHQINAAQKQLKSVETALQITRERHEQRAKKGRDEYRNGRQPDKILAGSMKNNSGQTLARNTSLKALRTSQSTQALVFAKSQLEIKTSINADFQATNVPQHKQVLMIEELCFAYPNQPPIFKDFNLTINGPERFALLGKNGAGKKH